MSARVKISNGRITGADLTSREMQVLECAASGLSTSDTAGRLHLATDTVRKHRQTMMDKLGSRNIVHAVHLAHVKGLLHQVSA